MLSHISDEQLKIGYLNEALDSIHYKQPDDTILSTFCTGMTTTLESLSNSQAKKELEAKLKAFSDNPENPLGELANVIVKHQVILTFS